MRQLLGANLRYQSRTVIYGFSLAMVLTALVNVVLPVIGAAPDPEDDFKLYYFFPVATVFLGLFMAATCCTVQRREAHIVMQMLLPRTRWQIAMAHTLAPPLLLLACLAVALIMMLSLQVITGTGVRAWRFYFLTYFAGFFLTVIEGPILIGELKPYLQRSKLLQIGLFILILLGIGAMLLRVLDRYLHLLPAVSAALMTDIALNPESIWSSVLLHGVGWTIVALNTLLYAHRQFYDQ